MTKRQPVSPQDWMVDLERRLKSLERRTAIGAPSDLLGPGIDTQAVLVTDWNGEEMDFNGLYYSLPGALHTPDLYTFPATKAWIGQNIVDPDGHGYQRVTHYRLADAFTQSWASGLPTYTRTFQPQGNGARAYGLWLLENWSIDTAQQADTTINSTTAVELNGMFFQLTITDPTNVYMVAVTVDLLHSGANNNSQCAIDLRRDGTPLRTAVFHAQGISGLRVPVTFVHRLTNLPASTIQLTVNGRVFATPETYIAQADNSHISIWRLT